MANLKPVRRGDTWHGHLWVVDDPAAGAPKDLSGWAFALEVRETEGIDGELAWSATMASGGLQLIDGDGREVEISCCGSRKKVTRKLEPLGYPYVVQAVGVDPGLVEKEWYFRLRAVDPTGSGAPIRMTLDDGRWSVTK